MSSFPASAEALAQVAQVAPEPRGPTTRHAAAEKAMNAVFAWGDAHIAGGVYRRNFRLMHEYFWRLRLEKIRYDRLAEGPGRILIKFRAMARIGWLYIRLLRVYE